MEKNENKPADAVEQVQAAGQEQPAQEQQQGQAQQPDNNAEKGKKSTGQEIFDWVKSIAGALAIVTVFDRFFDNWERGDVVICNYPDPSSKGYRVKRIIGLPGDTIEVKDGVTYVNGEALEED